MSRRNDWLPGTRYGQYTMARNWTAMLTAKKTAWNVPEEAVISLGDLVKEAWKAYLGVQGAEATKTARFHCRAAFAGLARHMRDLKRRYFLTPPLDAAALTDLGLKPHDSRPTPIHRPHLEAEADIIYPGQHLLELVRIRTIGTAPREDERAYHGVSIHCGIPDASERNAKYRIPGPPETGDDLPYSVFTRRKKRLFDFDGDSGRRVFFCLRYENSKGGEEGSGPFGPIQEAIIP